MAALLLSGAVGLAACGTEGPAGPSGTNGVDGADGDNGDNGTDGDNGADGSNGSNGSNGSDGSNGTDGTNGSDGTDGENGETGGNVEIASLHGTQYLMDDALEHDNKYYATSAITKATIVAGKVTVDFTVEDADKNPVTGITSVGAALTKLVPNATDGSNSWVPYIYRSQKVESAGFPYSQGIEADQGYRENDGTLTDNGDGSYRYELKTDVSAVVTPIGKEAVAYDATLTHRVAIMMGGHSGPTSNANLDFVPDGSPVTKTRNIVETKACTNCHGPDFHGHGGDRITVENCVTCHNPATVDPHSGHTMDMKVLIHKIHAGGALASIPGADGIVWDDPATSEDESADNGTYAIYGYKNYIHEWWKVEFPAVPENCTKCHTGSGTDVDNWKSKPSRDACGSCHDNIDWVAGTNHAGGPQTKDDACDNCHPSSGAISQFVYPVPAVHEWMEHFGEDKTPEFELDVTVSTPNNGKYFDTGESPVITVVLKDKENNNQPLDHSNLESGSAEGCGLQTDGTCATARDGKLGADKLMVHGPRGNRKPVLTTAARVEITSTGVGNWNITSATTLDMVFDGGKDLYVTENGGSILSASVSVAVPAASYTPTTLAALLNADSDFAVRGIAYLEAGGELSIRSRNLGQLYTLQLGAGEVTTAVFNGDTAIKNMSGYYPYAHIGKNNGDPKVTYSVGDIKYTLDPVDDLAPGTYIVTLEISDRGRKSSSDYKTPSVIKVNFQVKQETEELVPAGNCSSCHQNEAGEGFILDFARHYKVFDDTAIDQCGACHDTMSNSTSGSFYGGKPISKRVHAIHYGSSLNYPLLAVDYSNGDPVKGRNWDITFPQDVRNCEACHTAGTTSGSWKTEASRLPCLGCHDSDAAQAHIKLQTYDPTPDSPWSGDEEESCKACHGG